MTPCAKTAGVIAALMLVGHALTYAELFHVPPPTHAHVDLAQADMTTRQEIVQDESGVNRSDCVGPSDWRVFTIVAYL